MIHNPTFYMNAELCTGCKTCMIACKDKHDLPVGVQWRRVLEFSGGEWLPVGNAFEQNIFSYYMSIACNHCDDPLCVSNCPTQAMHKDEYGIVSVDPSRCVGCRYCEWSCPYGAPQFHHELKYMTKCDFCKDYLEQGLTPACVASCPCRALDFGEYDEIVAKYGLHETIAPLPSPELTKPRLIVAPHRHSRPLGSTAGTRGSLLSNPEEV